MANPGKTFDRIKETTTTTGTGNLTLAGAVVQFKTFASRYTSGATAAAADSFYYGIVGQGTAEWEVGIGYLSGSTTLVRDQILASSNADAVVSFSAGTKEVFVTIGGAQETRTPTKGISLAQNMGQAMP